MYIAKAHGLTVYFVFTFAGTVEPAHDCHFLKADFKGFVMVVKCNGHRCEALRFSGCCSCKYDILHIPASQLLGALLSEHPSDRVRNIGLAAPVRTDDAGDSFGKLEDHLVGKGLKALHFNPF